jgi:hypothetical protein
MNADLPQSVKRLLTSRIETHDQLQALLLVYEGCGRFWTPQSASEVMGIPPPDARAALEHLCGVGLGVRELHGAVENFSYHPRPLEVDEAVRELAAHYDQSRVEIMQLIAANAIERVRTGAIKLFTDPFRPGKDEA